MKKNNASWNDKNLYKVGDKKEPCELEGDFSSEQLRSEIEPWLTALFQSEHLSLLIGSGLTTAIHLLACNKPGTGMGKIEFSEFNDEIEKASNESAQKSWRGIANIEDQIRICNELIKGIKIYYIKGGYGSKKAKKKLNKFEKDLDYGLRSFANNILKDEYNIINSSDSYLASEYLMSFLISFASRSATRERLNIFTTNYDRMIEFGSELAGIRLIDRFVGTINPIFNSSRVEVDMHYNPPGIRGEPRYLEGVAQFSKLHGSLDWSDKNGIVRRYALPYGAENINNYLSEGSKNLLIYPNASKDRETSEYPYVELFRDFASSICRPNSTVVVYGYSFGDDHINRVISDMLTIPSTHLVIISFDDKEGRIERFYEQVKRPTQITLLLGNHFGNLKNLVDIYLPKPAIDRTTIKMTEILKSRGIASINDEKNSEVGE